MNTNALFDISRGFLNSTQITFGGSRSECQFAVQDSLNNGQKAVDILVETWFSYMDLWRFVDAFLHVPYNLPIIILACHDSRYEVEQLLEDYVSLWNSSDAIMFNIFYNGGNIMKGFTNIWMYFIATDYTRVKTPFDLGMQMGQIFWLTFYPA